MVRDALAIGMLNVCHLKNKTDDLAELIDDHNMDIFGVVETFLDDSVPDAMVQQAGYTMHRKDRGAGIGGGIAIFVKNSISSCVQRRSDLEHDDLELLFLEVRDCKHKYLLAFLYRPPSSRVSYWDSLNLCIQHSRSGRQDRKKDFNCTG